MSARSRLDLLNNPEFIADIRGTESIRTVSQQWGCSFGYVQGLRAEGPPAPKPTPLDVSGHYKFEDDGTNVTIQTHATTIPQTMEDVYASFRAEGLNPDDFDISVKRSKWENGAVEDDGTLRVLHSCAITARRKPEAAVGATLKPEDIEAARQRVQTWKLPQRSPGTGLGAPVAAVLNLADIQGGKSEGGGVKATEQRLLNGLENFERWVERQRAGGRNINEIVIVNNGDPYEGCSGNYATQLFTVELNHRGQMNFVLDMWSTYARELYPQFEKGQFVSVLCNHGEMGRFGAKKNQTSDSDGGGALLAEVLQRILSGRDEFDHIKWTIPHDEMNVFTNVAGVPMGFNHGHKIPGNDATGFTKWLDGQVRGSRDAYEAKVWVTAHRHNFQCFDLGSATAFQCPSVDGGSKWLRDMTGHYSRSGILALLVGEHDPLGWSDPVFL